MTSCGNFVTRKNDQSTEQMPALRTQQRYQTQRFKTEGRSSRCQRRERPVSMSISGGSTTAQQRIGRRSERRTTIATTQHRGLPSGARDQTRDGAWYINLRKGDLFRQKPRARPRGHEAASHQVLNYITVANPRGPERGTCHVVRPGTIDSWN